MVKIKAIGFDYGGVVGGDPSLGKYFTEQNAKLLGITPEEWHQVYFSMNHLLNTGATPDKVDFWRQFLNHFDQVDKLDQVLSLDNELSNKYLVINKDVIALIDQLRRANYKTGLLSNATGEVGNKIKNLNISHHFDSFLFSADIGLQKPDPLAFAALARSLEVEVAEMIFIDDAKNSLKTAQECGFTPILFKDVPNLESSLIKLGLTY